MNYTFFLVRLSPRWTGVVFAWSRKPRFSFRKQEAWKKYPCYISACKGRVGFKNCGKIEKKKDVPLDLGIIFYHIFHIVQPGYLYKYLKKIAGWPTWLCMASQWSHTWVNEALCWVSRGSMSSKGIFMLKVRHIWTEHCVHALCSLVPVCARLLEAYGYGWNRQKEQYQWKIWRARVAWWSKDMRTFWGDTLRVSKKHHIYNVTSPHHRDKQQLLLS